MSDSAIQLPADGTGKSIDTRTVLGGDHRQVVVVGDPDTDTAVAPVSAADGLLVNLGANNDVAVSGTVIARAAELAVALGSVSGQELVVKFGRNPDVDTGTTPEDMWSNGGVYTGQPTGSAEAVRVSSTSTSDAAAGTGARTIRIVGLNAAGAETTEDITMNGTSNVVSSGTWLRVFRAYVLTVGSNGSNVGTITIGHNVTTANVFATIPVGFNQTLVAAYTVPAGKTAYVLGYSCEMSLSGGGAASAVVSLRTREQASGSWANQPFRARRVNQIAQGQPVTREMVQGALSLPALTDIKWRVESVSSNNTQATGSFTLLLVDN